MRADPAAHAVRGHLADQEVAFRIHGDQIEAVTPRMCYEATMRLVEATVLMGHFTADSLVRRRAYFPRASGCCAPRRST